MPDIFGASGQFSIDSLGQQNQNALNNAYGSGGFGGSVGQYAPYPMFGGPIDTGPAPSVFSRGAAPVPNQDLVSQYYQLTGQNRGQPQAPWYPQQDPPATFDQRFPQSSAPATFDQRFPQSSAPATFDQRFPQSSAPATFDQRFPQSPATPPVSADNYPGMTQNNSNDLTARYYQLMGGGGGGAQPASMSMNPWLSMGGRPNMMMPSIDPSFDRDPQGVLGHPGTLDRNVIDPNDFMRPRMDSGSGRDAITTAMLGQQVAQGSS